MAELKKIRWQGAKVKCGKCLCGIGYRKECYHTSEPVNEFRGDDQVTVFCKTCGDKAIKAKEARNG